MNAMYQHILHDIDRLYVCNNECGRKFQCRRVAEFCVKQDYIAIEVLEKDVSNLFCYAPHYCHHEVSRHRVARFARDRIRELYSSGSVE